jgi:tRNA1Val (adenine37-N6)-methyltransferase
MLAMSSLNLHYTFQYIQPEEYRFSHDSVFLARKVFEINQADLGGFRGLDLCSGCGIVGLDFLFHCKTNSRAMPESFDFIEVQDVYEKYFNENKKAFGSGLPTVHFLIWNYEKLKEDKSRERYDLIICNPPYFRPDQGSLSPSEFKNRCRFFIDSDFRGLLEGIGNSLKPKGSAYVLLRDLKAHGADTLEEAKKILSSNHIEVVADIRGTSLIKISGTADSF